MKLVSKLLFILFMFGLVSVFLPQKVLAVSDDGITPFHLYQLKANQCDADAQFNLALLYYHGLGVAYNSKQAVYWYTKAAEQGFVHAQYSLGRKYQYGNGAPQDYKQAFFWYTKASEKGYYFAKVDRDEMLEIMSQSQIEEVQKLSKKLYEKIYSKAK